MNDEILVIRDLETHYGKIHAVRGINITVKKGQIVALLGANGAGKSTTLKAISGLVGMTSGTITFKEKDITIGGKNLGEIINSSEIQQNIEQKITKIAKILIVELFEKGMDFKEKTKTIRKERKVGRPKVKRKSGRPKQGLD